MPDDLHARLVAALHARLEVARAACHGGEGRWRQVDAEREHGRIEDERGEVVTYDESSPTEAQAAHIAANDPAAEIRQVEALLRVVERHYEIERKVNWVDADGGEAQTHIPVCVVCVPKYGHFESREEALYPCLTIRDLAAGEGIEP